MTVEDIVEVVFNDWDRFDGDDQKELLDELCSVATAAEAYEMDDRELDALRTELRSLQRTFDRVRP